MRRTFIGAATLLVAMALMTMVSPSVGADPAPSVASVSAETPVSAAVSKVMHHQYEAGSYTWGSVTCWYHMGSAHRFFTAWETEVQNGRCWSSNGQVSNIYTQVAAVTGHDWTGAEIYRSFPDYFTSSIMSNMSGNVPNLAVIRLWVTMCPKPPLTGACMVPTQVASM